MPWDEVIGQDRVKQRLQRAIHQNRVAHAYLFYGPYGTGKRATAFAFARALQCKVSPGTGCSDCSDCSRINRMMHPDVRFFMPAPKEIEQEEIVDRLQALGRNPYETIDFIRRPTVKSANKQAIYPKSFIMEHVRPVVGFMAFEAAYKVVVLLEAEALGAETGNVFLKLLEEPSPNSVFILITERPDQLLPTIVSRCQPIRFGPIPADEVERALIDRDQISKEEAVSNARLADGSFSTARDLIHDQLAGSYRALLFPFLRSIWSNKLDEILEVVDEIAAQPRDQIKLFLSLMMVLIRDMILMRELGEEAQIVNQDVREAVYKFVNNLKQPRLDQMVSLVEEAWYLVTRNVRPTLILTSLAAGLRASMLDRPAMPLLTPLAEQIMSDLE